MSGLAGPAYALSVGFWLSTSFYALLASQPFAYEQFLKPQLLPPLARFAEWHPWLNGIVFVLDLGARWPRFAGAARRANIGLSRVWGVLSVALLLLPRLESLGPGALAPAFAALALLPVAGILWAEVAVATRGPRAMPDPAPRGRIPDDFFGCLAAAVAATVLYTFVSRWLGPVAPAEPPFAGVAGFAQSLLVHLLLAAAVFGVITLVRGLAAFHLPDPRRAECGLACVVLAATGAVVVHTVVLPGLSIRDPAGRAVASAWGLLGALAIAVRGLSVSQPEQDGVSRVLSALIPRRIRGSYLAAGVWLVAIGILGLGLASAATQMDWNGILSRLGVIITWLLLLAVFVGALPTRRERGAAVFYLSTIALLAAHAGVSSPLAARQLARVGVDLEESRRATRAADPAFRLLDEILEPPARAELGFVSMLQQNTNISRSLAVAPVDLTLAALEGAASRDRPHIFLFVVDSLRRDYLSPYNASVTFTPEIARFAADAVVFENAFTRYGATGLSVPALWTGSPVLHKQYVLPFAPMNTLAKLLSHEAYAQWIGMDNILDLILPESEAREPLDADVMVKDFRFCRTLEELQLRLAGRAPDSAPVFAYTLPQDIHVSVVTREGSGSIDSGEYPGFSAPVASRIRSFDTCFGGFLDFLHATGLYEESLIVLTSDHGDSLGEQGRMGHAYGLFPEVIRIPLIVSLPERLRRSWRTDPAQPAYNTDLTPTLYRLLGHEVMASSRLFGRSLFVRPGEEAREREEGVMVASSYGAVYGALLDGARRLYIIDTVNLREHGYALDGELLGEEVPVDGELRRRGQATIQDTIQALAELHDFRPKP